MSADFNYDDSSSQNSYFYEVREKDRINMERLKGVMQCLAEPDELQIWGNFDTESKQSF